MTLKLLRASWLSCALLLASCGGGGYGGGSSYVAPPPPSTPTGLMTTNVTDSSLTVSWTASTDVGGPGIGGYLVIRNGNAMQPIAAVSGTSYTDSILIPGTTYTYEVVAYDQSANSVLSATSATLNVPTTGVTPTNVLPVMVDTGPSGLTNTNQSAANTLYATVTLCTPGNLNSCQQIDHVQVDTGSVGLQIMAEVRNGSTALPALNDPTSGSQLRECVQFADGYTWGSMVVADVQIGGRTLPSMPVHLLGDQGAGAAPADCAAGAGPLEDTVAVFGANGVLGIGNFLQDCGALCTTNPPPTASYYICPNNICSEVTVALANQLQNPLGVAALAPDNNGVVISLPPAGSTTALSVTGVLYFGIATQADNAIGVGVQFFPVDPSAGTLLTTYPGHNLAAGSIIDSGSNAYFFASSLTACANSYDSSFYCPAASTSFAATIQGATGAATKSVNVTVDNADQLFNNFAAAFPTLGGPNSGTGVTAGSFDWGLPFFYNNTVYVLFEANTAGGTNGPAVGF